MDLGTILSNAWDAHEEEIAKNPIFLGAKMDVYLGSDPNLQEKPCCFSCLKRSEGLKWCTRCKVASHCNRDCQIQNFADHKSDCKSIFKLKQKIESERERLSDSQIGISYERGNVFEEQHMGHLWGYFEPRDMMRKMYDLAQHIEAIAYEHDQKHLFEIVLENQMELLRFAHGDNLGVRYSIVFTLLSLNRDKHVWSIVKWYETIDPDGNYDWGSPAPEFKIKGNWPYPMDVDILEDPSFLSRYTSLPHLVAMLVVKLRLVVKLEQEHRTCSLALKGSKAEASSSLVEDFCYGGSKVLEQQKHYASELIKTITGKNKTVLPAIVNPGPLMKLGMPEFSPEGSPEEAFFVVMQSKRHFARIPFALNILESLVGSTYSATYQDFSRFR